jgi:katanin p80 WD40 repeat-containing subunit B1
MMPCDSSDILVLLLSFLHAVCDGTHDVSYMSVGCTSLKLILKNFASMIKTNITAPPGIGVDISREER